MRHYNSSISRIMIDGLNLKGENSTNEINDIIIPTFETNPRLVKDGTCYVGANTNSTATTMVTLPADKQFYITGACITTQKDATATSTSFNISITKDAEVGKQIIVTPGVTLTAGIIGNSIMFSNPIKVDKGTAIIINSATNVGNFRTSAVISGYFDEY